MEIYGLKDKACGIIHVFVANNIIAAKRAMAEAMDRNPGELMYRYSDDFDLLKIAKIDPNTGELDETNTEFICNLTTLKRSEK